MQYTLHYYLGTLKTVVINSNTENSINTQSTKEMDKLFNTRQNPFTLFH